MSDFDEYFKEQKKKRLKAENLGYVKGMVASAILSILVGLVSGALSDNPLGLLIMGVCAAVGSVPAYWMLTPLWDPSSYEPPVWWHLPASLIVFAIAGKILETIFRGY